MKNNELINHDEKGLFDDLSLLIKETQNKVIKQTNSALVTLFWQVGKRISNHILHNQRADYGKQIVVTLSRQLTEEYGRNFEEKNLRRMVQFVEEFDDSKNVVTLSRQLSWSHFLTLIPLKKPEAKQFYSQKAATEGWSVRELRKQIETKSFERTLIANSQLPIKNSNIHNVFKDPYLLDFLKLDNSYLEKDLESAILRDLQGFILELGKGFAFVDRQKRIIIDGEDYYLDLLFFHRKLKRLVVIELKIGKFQAKYKGQMELYLKWLDKNEKQEGEDSPIGLILCTETSKEQIELLEMHKDGIMVAEYLTELPPKQILEKKLHQAYLKAQERLEINQNS
jgi:predicted nuclease of restriction endonuclease-like (RecB) superfamily